MLCLSALCALFLLFSACAMLVQSNGNLQTYIVHVNRPDEGVPAENDDLESFHRSFLPKEIQSSDEALDRLLYSYRHAMSGFSARLTSKEVSTMHDREGFVSARLESVLQLQTTHSANFLGLPQNLASVKGSHLGKGVIIGVLDGGVLPTHPSFNGVGMPPPPGKWKGRCDFRQGQCNNKLIGARTFDLSSKARAKTSLLPDDEDGHGTHTASTAAGAFVHGAQVLGNVKGTAVGMAPDAHLAIYKVCFDDCPEADILAALDAAVDDGVDVLSLSIGDVSKPFFNDTIAIGSFAAIQKGIFVSCAAGNFGPVEGSLSNEAPWILTVGASTIDRNVVSTTKLGNGLEFDGETVFQPYFPSKLIPLIYAGANGKPNASLCAPGSLNPADVKGKVVLCERGVIGRIAKGQVVKDAGGAAMILMNDEASGFSTIADAHVLPASQVSHSAGLQIKAYINSTKAPTATLLFKGTVLGNPNTPAVASFSSRGPNLASPGILKPDIIGPGVSILAAWPFPLNNDTKSKLTFNVDTGTSMSCPHLSGIAALLKSAHPNWSPAAIKSAIMTTAEQQNQKGSPIVDERQQPADVFAIGAGHVNPTKANDPGLIYDISPIDYIPYLCGLGYTDQQVGIVAGRLIRCSKWPSIPEGELNYPSFAVTLGPSTTFTRTVTNVGKANSRYTVTVIPPPGVNIVVKPPSLYFRELNQKATYSVTFTRAGSALKPDKHVQGYLRWVSGKYRVRSPISVQFKKPKLL